MGPERHGPLHRRRRQPGQHRRVLRPRVRRGALVVALPESPAIEQARDARLHRGQHLRDVQGRQATRGVKVRAPAASLAKTPSNTSAWTWTFRLSAPPNRWITATRPPTIRTPLVARASAQQPEHGAEEHGDDGAAQVVVPRQLVPQAVRQTQHPLPHGHVGEHVIDQVGGALGHPAAAATRTQRAAFAGKRDQPVEAAVAAAKPREPAGEPATPQKVPKLLLDEAGQPFPSRRLAACARKVSK